MLVSTYFEIVGQQQRGLDLYGFVTGPFWGRMKCYTRRVGLGSSCATAAFIGFIKRIARSVEGVV